MYTAAGYWETLESSGVDGIMIGRGALIKPWILRVALSQETLNAHMTLSLVPYSTEIKERREWDISSRERLDIIRKVSENMLITAHTAYRHHLQVCGIRP